MTLHCTLLGPSLTLIGRLCAPEANAIPIASPRPAQRQPAQHQRIQHQRIQHQPMHLRVGQGLQVPLPPQVHPSARPLQVHQHLLALLPAQVQAPAHAMISAAFGQRAILVDLTRSTWEMAANALVGAHQPTAKSTAFMVWRHHQQAVEMRTEVMSACLTAPTCCL